MQADDFQQQGLGHGYDVALVFGVLNGEPPEAPIFALQMLLATEAGGLDTSNDWARRLAEVEFAPPWVGGDMTIAVKTLH